MLDFRRYISDRKGTLAITSAVGMTVAVVAIGVAVDATRLLTHHHQLQAVADTSALAAARPVDLHDKERMSLATSTAYEYRRQTFAENPMGRPDVQVGPDASYVDVTLSETVELIFSGAIGKNDHTIRANARAEEYFEEPEAATSVSIAFVVDLSSSMDADKRVSKLRIIQQSVNGVIGSMPSGDTIETGFYPFNWGMVDGSVAEMQPGSAALLTALNSATTGEGAVASSAMEKAVEAQTQDDDSKKKRVIVLLTDSGVDGEKGDSPGEYVAPEDLFAEAASEDCKKAQKKVEEEQDDLAKTFVDAVRDWGFATSLPLNQIKESTFIHVKNGDPADNLRRARLLKDLSAELLVNYGGHGPKDFLPEADEVDIKGNRVPLNLQKEAAEDLEDVAEDRRKLVNNYDKMMEACVSVQERRVLKACERARGDNVSLIAVDMGDASGDAARLTRDCAFGEREMDETLGEPEPVAFPYADITESGGTGPGDPSVYTAQDGSQYVSVESAADLRSVLEQLMPGTQSKADPERIVKLVR